MQRISWCLNFTLLVGCATASQDLGDNGSDALGGTQDGGERGPQGARRKMPASDAAAGTTSEGGAADTGIAKDTGAAGSDGRPCGGTCHNGSTCVAGACEFVDCAGSTVPGDYATVQDAADALKSTGGTICLKAMTYPEDVFVVGSRPLRVIGVSAAKTVVRSFRLSQSVALTGLATTADTTSEGGTQTFTAVSFVADKSAGFTLTSGTSAQLHFVGSRVAGKSAGISLSNNPNATGSLVTVDGCDLSATGASGANNGVALLMNEPTTSPDVGSPHFALDVVNSYLHDSGIGFSFTAYRGCSGCVGGRIDDALSLANNTFFQNGTAVLIFTERQGAQSLSAFNNLVVQNQVGVVLPSGGQFATEHGSNAYFGNTANFQGTTDGPGDVKQDPLLDTSVTPPRLKVASPARGAGERPHAPNHDYWGTPRGASIDIGAVQGL